MAYFKDLSQYDYLARHCPPGAENVGWLEQGQPFKQLQPSDTILAALWSQCKVSVMQTRGFHQCDLCPSPAPLIVASRGGDRLRLGSAEIRVFSRDGKIYAAPNLIYHYVRTHHYKLPDEFLTALTEGPRPPGQELFQCLNQSGLDWSDALRFSEDTRELRPTVRGSRFQKVDGELRRIDV